MNVVEIFNLDKFLNINTNRNYVVKDITGKVIEERKTIVTCYCGELEVGNVETEEIVLVDSGEMTTISFNTLSNTQTSIKRYASDELDKESYLELESELGLNSELGYDCISSVVSVVNSYNKIGELEQEVCNTIYILR